MISALRPAGYGLTETSPTTHLLHRADAPRKMGSIGPLLPNLEARLVADAGGTAVEAEEGSPGELWIRGPSVMKVRPHLLNAPIAAWLMCFSARDTSTTPQRRRPRLR